MSNRMKFFLIAGVVLGIVVLLTGLPAWVGGVIILAAIGIPVAGYFMLDPSQRRKVRQEGRKRIGR